MMTANVLRAVCGKSFRFSTSIRPAAILQLQSFRMASTLPNLAIFQAITKHDPASTAIIHSDSNQSFSYGTLLRDVVATKKQLSQTVRESPLRGERIAFLAENSYDYVGMWHVAAKLAMVTSLQ